MKIILTGATGFVGKNLLPYLSPLYDITALNLRTVTEGNIDLNADSIIHLAGKAHDLKKVANEDEYYQVNFELTKILYDAFLKSDAKNFVFISSIKAVSDAPETILVEDTLTDPQTHYGKSKLMAEEYIKRQPLTNGKRYYILRPCMIHGPGNKGNLNLLYKFIAKGIPYPLAGFENKRSYLSVENLCFVIRSLIESKEVESGVYNVADDEALSTNEVVELIALSMNRTPRLWTIPKVIIVCCAKIGDFFNLGFSTERLEKMTSNYVLSNHKLKKLLKVELPLTAKQGISITANSFNNT